MRFSARSESRIFEILRWLPVIVNLLTIPAFFLLAETLLEDRPRAALGTVFYALTPVYGWEIMGGGLTRSFGALFMLLALHFSVRSFKTGSWKFVFLASLFGGLSVMSHPETAMHTVYGIAFFWLFTKHSWKKLLQAFVLALLAGVVSAPWWLTVYLQHGLSPFLSAASSGVHDLSPLNVFFGDLFARDTFIPILMILRVAGIILGGGSSPLHASPLGGSRLFSRSTQCLRDFVFGVLASLRDWFCRRVALCRPMAENKIQYIDKFPSTTLAQCDSDRGDLLSFRGV